MSALSVNSLLKAFGGVKAIQDVSFDVEAGSVHAIIGPNGAGKTTLINLITGVYSPDSGSVALYGTTVTGEPPENLAGLGLSRTFQNLQLCMNMSAVDNVLIGAHLSLNSRLIAGIFRPASLRRKDFEARERSLALMEFVGVGAYSDMQASQMPYGALKRLEIARALAASPKLLLMDEPAAGLNMTETAEVERLIRKIADKGITVVLVEHDMKLVMNVSDRILVLNYGRMLALGTPDEARRDPEVVSAYLGAAV